MNANRENTLSDDQFVRDKINFSGIETLSDTELLALLMGKGSITGQSMQAAKQALEGHSLEAVATSSRDTLLKTLRLTPSVATLLSASAELARRIKGRKHEEIEHIHNSMDAARLFAPLLGPLPHEEFWVALLNNAGRVIRKVKISHGGVTNTVVDIRIIMRSALETLAGSILLVHNHPSMELVPSEEDIRLTQKIVAAANLLDIAVLDHIIIGGDNFLSFRDKKLL